MKQTEIDRVIECEATKRYPKIYGKESSDIFRIPREHFIEGAAWLWSELFGESVSGDARTVINSKDYHFAKIFIDFGELEVPFSKGDSVRVIIVKEK